MTAVSSSTDLTLDREAHTIVLTRVFSAPPELIFEAWTRPEHVGCWWNPSGEPLAECEIDLRPGGAFRFVHGHAPGAPQFAGVYREVEPPHHILFDTMGATGRVTFAQAGDNTLLTVRIECRSAEQFEQFLKMGIDTGTAKTLDNLVLYIGSIERRTRDARSEALSHRG